MFLFFCFFKQKTAYEMRISDWSSDVCSSDLRAQLCRNASHPGQGYRPRNQRSGRRPQAGPARPCQGKITRRLFPYRSAAPITRAPGKVFDAISHLDDRPLVGGRRAYSSGIATAPLRDRGLPLALTPCKAGASPFFILPTDRRRASLRSEEHTSELQS